MMCLVLLLGLGVTFVEMSIQELTRASREKKETQALALAEAGLDYGAWHLYNEAPTSYPFTLTRSDLGEGSFSAVVDHYVDADGNPVANAVEIVSTGTSQGFTSEVKAIGHYAVSPGPNSPVFDSALFSNADLTLKGTADINGSVRTNGNMSLQGTPNVTQDATAVGWIKDPKGGVQGTKTPSAARMTFPVVDTQYYRGNATHSYASSQTFSGTIELDGITFVDGDVNISGQVSGKGVIVATGTVHVNGNVTRTNGDDDEFALISTTGIRINGTCDIEGTLYAHSVSDSAITIGNGTATVLGAIVSDVITVNGTLNVTYKEPTVPLPGAQSAPIQVDLVSWRRLR
jgi:hypothetical protein